MIVNKAKLSDILGVSERSLTTWASEGMPVDEISVRGASNRYDTAAVIRWMIERETGNDYSAQRTRLTKEQADKTALDNRRLRGELVATSAVQAQLEREFGAIRSRLLAIPTKLSPQIITCKTLPEAQESLRTLVHECLTDLANFELRDEHTEHDETGEAGVYTTAEPDSKRVGRQASKAKPRGKRRTWAVED